MAKKYKNKYGYLEMETIEEYRPVGEISSKNYDKKDSSIFFNIEMAEQIALITENDDTHIGCVFPEMNIMFLIHYKNGKMAAVCRIKKIEYYSSISAENEIELAYKMNKGREEAYIQRCLNN